MNEELKIFITAQIDDLKKSLGEAQKETQKTAKEGSSNFKKFGEAAKTAGKAIGTAMKAAVAAIAAAATALVAVAESTREYRTEQAKLTSAFESAGASAEQAKETYNDLYRVLGDSGQATEAANHLALLTTNEKELAEWTTICQGVYATFGDSLPIEGLTEAANETAKVGQVTGSLADALNWAGISEDAFNEKLAACNTEAEREALIRETLNGIYAESAANYEKNAADILAANEAQAKLTDGLAALGAAVEPIITIFKSGLGDVLQELVPHFETLSQALQDVINGVEGGADRLSAGIGALIGTVLEKLVDILPGVLQVGVDIINALLEGIIKAFPSIIKTVLSLLPTIINAILTLLPQLTGAILEALPLVLDGILQLVAGILQALPDIILTIIDQIIACIPLLIDALMTNLPMIIEGIFALVNGIVGALPDIILAIVDILPQLISSILSGLMACLPQLLAGLVQLVMEIVIALPQILLALVQAVINIFTGLWDGIVDIFANCGDWFKDAFTGAWEGITEAFSKAGQFFKDVWGSITSALAPVGRWFSDMFGKAWQGIKNAFSSIGSFFSGIWNNIKNIFSKVGTAIADGIKKAVSTAVNKVLSVACKIINGFIDAINFAIGIINAIPGVSISKISRLSVPAMAKGGVVDSATLALIGEQGKEAVVPLENNTEWIDMLASRLSGAMGGKGPVILQVDGRTFAEISCDSINQLTRQRGSLALNLY